MPLISTSNALFPTTHGDIWYKDSYISRSRHLQSKEISLFHTYGRTLLESRNAAELYAIFACTIEIRRSGLMDEEVFICSESKVWIPAEKLFCGPASSISLSTGQN